MEVAIGLKLASIENMDHLDTLTTLTMWFGIVLDNVLHVCFPARWWRNHQPQTDIQICAHNGVKVVVIKLSYCS